LGHGIVLSRSLSGIIKVRCSLFAPSARDDLLYQVVQEYWPEFQAELASHGKTLPAYVTKEFDAYLKCGRLEYGFLRVRCEACHDEKLQETG
jgi:hypothetical protein